MACVALESAVISHGLPYPQNVETALEIENIVRKEGAVPKTIAIIDGKVKIGVTLDEIERIGRGDVQKISCRDIPYAIAMKKSGGTTVSATMVLAEKAGIHVFSTGGIGGVHRGFEHTMDISADLYTLSSSNVAVVCAGAKLVLDISRTLEMLETLGVPVVGYQTDQFPAFYSQDSGIKMNSRINSVEEAAHLITTKWKMGLKGGVVIAQPVPEADALPFKELDTIIENAIAQMKGIVGKQVTPYLLREISSATEGRSLKANIALLKNNAKLASHLAQHI